MFLLSNITWSETATYECNEINTWVSIYQSLSLWLVTGAAFLTFCPAGSDDSGPRGSSGHLHNQGGSTWRSSVCLVQSSLDIPQTESLPTRQEGQVRTSQDSHPQAVLLYCWPWCRIAILSPGGIHDHNENGRETGNSPGSQVSFAGPSLDLNPEGQGRGCSLRTTSISRLAKHLETLPANQLAAPQALSADSHCHQGAASGSTWTL